MGERMGYFMKKIILVFAIMALANLPVRPVLTRAEDTATSVPALEPAAEPKAAPELDPAPMLPAEPTTTLITEPGPASTTAPLLGVEPEPASSSTATLESIGTRFMEAETPQGTGGPLLVKALWEMHGPGLALLGTDDSTDAEAQFLPSGQFQVSRPFSVCAIVSRSKAVVDSEPVSSEIYYPTENWEDKAKDGEKSCGGQKEPRKQMARLAKADGLNLFCGKIRTQNSNLPKFNDVSGFGEICGQEGALQKETAAVFCSDYELRYNDPSGTYRVSVFGKDKGERLGNSFSGTFRYLELTAFENDFTSLNYGKVELGSKKVIEGDAVWEQSKAENRATLRNVGNTRLQIQIQQDDMGLGKAGNIWNIKYASRIGPGSAWTNYWPNEASLVGGILELGETYPVDFAVEVLGFPQDGIQVYSGKMTIDAKKANQMSCEAIQKHGTDKGKRYAN